MTETVYLTLPAAPLAAPAPPRGRARDLAGARDDQFRARDLAGARDFARDAAVSLSKAEAELRKAEVQAQARADARASTSTEAIVARARALMAEPGGTPNVIEAVHRARAEAATTLAATGANARESQAWERRQEQHGRVEETLADTALALERRLMAHARELIAAARRAMADDPLQARELAIRAREAMAAIGALYGKKPDHEPARLILQGARDDQFRARDPSAARGQTA